jgi:hypothetical protein
MRSGKVASKQGKDDCTSSARRIDAGVEPTVEFAFGAVFSSLLTIPLQAKPGEALQVNDLLPITSGRFWVADAGAWLLKVYSNDGHRIGSLDREATGLRRPVSLASLHERWIAVLDGYIPAVALLDEGGSLIRRFPLPELDRPVQIINLRNRRLAVVGTGWGAGAGHLVHLYTLEGDYVESLFGEPRDRHPPGRAYAAAAGDAFYIGHSHTDSFAVYDVEARAVVSFSNLNAPLETREEGDRYSSHELRGLFATACGPLIAQYVENGNASEHLYDLYGLDGTPIALGLRSPERVVGVEGPFFYSVQTMSQDGARLRVWKLAFGQDGPAAEGQPREEAG